MQILRVEQAVEKGAEGMDDGWRERQLELGIFRRWYGNLVRWKLLGIYRVNPSEDFFW